MELTENANENERMDARDLLVQRLTEYEEALLEVDEDAIAPKRQALLDFLRPFVTALDSAPVEVVRHRLYPAMTQGVATARTRVDPEGEWIKYEDFVAITLRMLFTNSLLKHDEQNG